MSWLYYLAEANIYLGVFYVAYCLFLNRETYYQLNRTYLLFSCIAAFILPVLQIGSLKPVETAAIATVNYTIPVQTTFNTVAAPVVVEQSLTLQDYLWYAYLVGAAILLLILIIKLYTLVKLVHSAKRVKQDKHKLVYLPETDVAFSFFNYLFIGTNAHGANTIIRHELVHINQKHSFDIIFLELLKIVNWFNPCIYLLQNSLKTVHEYIADEQTAAYEPDALTYSSFLVNNAYGAGGSSITHSFFNYNLLKKRIIMLNQQRSGNLARLKYLIAVPLCAGLLCASTLAFSKTYGWVDLAPAEILPTPPEPVINNKISYIINPATYTAEKLYELSTKLYKQGYKMDFKEIGDKNEITQLKITLETLPGVAPHHQAYGTFSLNGLKDINYVIVVGADIAKDEIYVRSKDKISAQKDVDSASLIPPAGQVKPNAPIPVKDAMSKIPPPSITKSGYEGLVYFIHKHMDYNAVKSGKGGEVMLSFIVNNDHTISAIKAIKSTDNKLDPFAINTIKLYKAKVTDNSGERKLLLSFYTGNYAIFNMIKTQPKDLVANLVINKDARYYETTSKGFDYQENSWVDENRKLHFDGVTIFEKNGEAKNYVSPISSDKIKMLKDKYGYQFLLPPPPPPAKKAQKVKVTDVKLLPPPPPANKKSNTPPVTGAVAPTQSIDFTELYKYIARNIKYPKEAKENNIEARTFTTFIINDEHKLTNISMLRTSSEMLSNEVLKVLQNYGTLPGAIPGKRYILPVVFVLVGDADKTPYQKPDSVVYKTFGQSTKDDIPLGQVVVTGYK